MHYKLIDEQLKALVVRSPRPAMAVMDAGCGVGGALAWLEQRHPAWELAGHTISEQQLRYIERALPRKRFTVHLRSYDKPETHRPLDAIYSIEAAIHSPDLGATLRAWSDALGEGGVIVLIDDFWSHDGAGDTTELRTASEAFRDAWLANSCVSVAGLHKLAAAAGLRPLLDRNIGAEYDVVGINYRGRAPPLAPLTARNSGASNAQHQGWRGGAGRRILTVAGALEYRLVVLEKVSARPEVRGQVANIGIPSQDAGHTPARKYSSRKQTSMRRRSLRSAQAVL